jgi:hypothetical protein
MPANARRRVAAALAIFAGPLLLLACAGENAPTTQAHPASPSQEAAATQVPPQAPSPAPSDPVAAVKLLIRTQTGEPQHSCDSYRRADGCPITDRLEARIQVLARTIHASPVCRCQNGPASAAYKTQTQTQTSAVVRGDLTWSAADIHAMLFTLLRSGGTWLVDDVTCATHPGDSSIYLAMDSADSLCTT